ncbi:MAG: L,D-transpeptidase [Candidatus Symbiothrix sp.]|jgi:lipoprotein-anchoring transpeptidase ErfK/SrfK|nr:L,D-transpeptidase [Candidatus Symbiothrix sp.]
MKKLILFAVICSLVTGNWSLTTAQVKVVKELTYNEHTLADTYPYGKTGTREFQWDKIKAGLAEVEKFTLANGETWGVLQNKSNVNGRPPLTLEHNVDEYKVPTDRYDVEQNQSIPLYLANDLKTPDRYGRDGSLIKITGTQGTYVIAKVTGMDGQYLIPAKYVHNIASTAGFAKVVVVDRTNQNISTYEKVGDTWKVRSMNPCTTGAHNPPLQHPTPLGFFVIQNKLEKMQFYVDGTTRIAGYAPYASRFSDGAYMHGVPVNKPHTAIVEFSATLGTIPRSHECVRNAASHAKFIYDNYPTDQALVYVIE